MENNIMHTHEVKVGNIVIGGDKPIVVQTMCNTHTSDVEASVAQCVRLYEAGAQMIRLTVPSMAQVENLAEIKKRLRNQGIDVPLVADVHFSSEIAIAAASVVEKVRINPGNFHKDHEKAREQFARLVEVCKANGTAIRIGLNHGSLGERITNLYGNTPLAMKEAVMEWIDMCVENDFENVVVSLKASNTYVMTEAYRLLAEEMKKTYLESHICLCASSLENPLFIILTKIFTPLSSIPLLNLHLLQLQFPKLYLHTFLPP